MSVRVVVTLVTFVFMYVVIIGAMEVISEQTKPVAGLSDVAGGEADSADGQASTGAAGEALIADEPSDPPEDAVASSDGDDDAIMSAVKSLTPQVITSFNDFKTQVSTGLAAAFVAWISGIVFRSPRDDEQVKQRASDRSKAIGQGGDHAPDVDDAVIERFRSLALMSERESVELRTAVRERLAETLALREKNRRGEAFRFVLMVAVVFAAWSPTTIVLEGAVAQAAASGSPLIAWAPWWVPAYAQSILLGLGALIAGGLFYGIYLIRNGRRGWTIAALIGGLGVGLCGGISLLQTSPAMFQAISADGWSPPLGELLQLRLFHFLIFTRLLAFPLLAFLGAIVVDALLGRVLTMRFRGADGAPEDQPGVVVGQVAPAAPAHAGV